ncbi:MAG: hypothetical protein PUF97_01975 [Bifidobacteriaceae bacterium]|nr:hypothetical protein [Bifidobacteriaceae bacterium]
MSVFVLPGVRLLKPLDEGERWIIESPAGKRFGVSPGVASIMNFMQVYPDVDAANNRFGANNVSQVIDMFAGCGIFGGDDGESVVVPQRRIREWGRLRIDSLFSIQITLLRNPSRIFAPFAGFGFVQWIGVAIIALLISLAGIVGIVADSTSFFQELVTPQKVSDYLLMVLLMIFIISLHEYAHGAVLTSFGGQVSRMGVMLFYLSPACFCDVSDGWRLNSRKRLAVASAGIISTFMLAGLCSMLRYIPGMPSFMATLVAGLYTGAIINAIPTVKFDGYFALMAWREQPFLRDNAMRQWKELIVDLCSGHVAKAVHGFSGRTIYGVCALAHRWF